MMVYGKGRISFLKKEKDGYGEMGGV